MRKGDVLIDVNTKRIQVIYIFNPLVDLFYFLVLARLYESTGRAVAVTIASASAFALHKMLKFFVKVFKRLYLLNPWMDQVDTLPGVRSWSEV